MATRRQRHRTAAPFGARRIAPGSIFIRFLKFGLLAWGGPAAQIAMIKHECVDEEGGSREASFKKLLAVYQILPGPEAHELCVYFGRLRGGKLGGFLAGLGFMLPGFILMLGLSVLYVEASLAGHLQRSLLWADCGGRGARRPRPGPAQQVIHLDVPLAVIAIVGFALTLWLGITFVLVLLGGGIAYELWKNGRRWSGRANSFAITPLALLAVAAGAITVSLTAAIFLEGLKAGLLTFGGAYTVIPFLREAAVENHHWLTAGQFNDGLAIGGILPAPLIIFSTFVGYIAGGLGGALVMTLGIFLPAFVFPIFFHRQLVAVSENERLHPFLLGVAAAVIGLIAAVTVTILETSITDVYSALIALGAFAALQRWHSKLTVVYVMASAGSSEWCFSTLWSKATHALGPLGGRPSSTTRSGDPPILLPTR